MQRHKIVNVVATASMNQSLDLHGLNKYGELFYDSDVYGGRVAYFKSKDMQGKVSIFSSGKMISIGTKSEKQAYHELKYAAKFLVEKGCATHNNLDFKTRNLVVTADFGNSVNLEKLSQVRIVIYEPEQFPAALVRFAKPYRASILVFASGKTVITGLTNQQQIEPTIGKLRQMLESIR